MKNEKRDYVAPDTEVKHVEIESAICASSGDDVDMKAEAPGSTIKAQQVNAEFETDNNFLEGTNASGWDKL